MIDVDAVRGETAGCQKLAHINSAGSSLPPDVVVNAAVEYLQTEAITGGYRIADSRMDDLNRVYRAGARLLGCREDELAFGSGAGEAWWRAFTSIPLGPGDTVLTGRSEYVANGVGLIQAQRRGINLEIIENDASGQLDVARLLARLEDRGASPVKLVCLTHVPMTSGLVNPIEAVGPAIKKAGALFLLDACQAAGQLPLNVDELACDFLAFTGRKWLRGPRGTGMLYVRREVMQQLSDPIFVDGRSTTWTADDDYELAPDATRFEFGETNFGGKVGLGVAIEYAVDLGIESIQKRVAYLSDRLRAELPTISGIDVYDQGVNKCGIVTFTKAGTAPVDVVAALRAQGINLAAPGARNSYFDLGSAGIDAVVRASPHYFNTDDELDLLLDALRQL